MTLWTLPFINLKTYAIPQAPDTLAESIKTSYLNIISPIILKYCFITAIELFAVFLEEIQVIYMPISTAVFRIALNTGSETLNSLLNLLQRNTCS